MKHSLKVRSHSSTCQPKFPAESFHRNMAVPIRPRQSVDFTHSSSSASSSTRGSLASSSFHHSTTSSSSSFAEPSAFSYLPSNSHIDASLSSSLSLRPSSMFIPSSSSSSSTSSVLSPASLSGFSPRPPSSPMMTTSQASFASPTASYASLQPSTPSSSSSSSSSSSVDVLTSPPSLNASNADNAGGGTMLAQLVQKVSTFRRQLVAEKLTNQQQAAQIEKQTETIREFEQRLREKDRLLLDALQAKAGLEQRLHLVSIEPLPQPTAPESASNDAQVREWEKLAAGADAKSKQTIVDEMKKMRDELNSLRWHHKKFEERTLADKFQSEQSRAALLAECDQHKREVEHSAREMAKLKSLSDEVGAQMRELQLDLETLREQFEAAQGEKKAYELQATKLQHQLTTKSLEFNRLSSEHSELQQTAAKLAERVFDLKIRAESLALPIRRFSVQLVSPSLLLTPAQIFIIKNPDTHDLLLHVSDGAEDRSVHLAAVQDVFPDPKGAQYRFCVVLSHKLRLTFEAPERDEIMRELREFIRLAAGV